MSTDYIFDGKVSKVQLLAAMAEAGLSRHVDKEGDWAVTDGAEGFLWVYTDPAGIVAGLVRYGASRPEGVIAALEEALGVSLVGEHEDRYWELVR